MFAPLLLFAAAAGAPPSAPAPSPALPPAPHLAAVRVSTPPVIDGVLDDEVWAQAHATSAFTQKYPNDGAPPTDPTTLRVLYDDEAVYVAFDCPQPKIPITPRLTRRDRTVEADAVLFDLGTRGDHKSSFEFYVNASGVLADAIRYNDTDLSIDWDENWDARTHVTPTGWSAEFRIPLRILRFSSHPVQSWDFQAARYTSETQENDTWSYFPRTVAGEVSHYGRLDDLRGLRQRSPIELRPFVLGRFRRRDPADGVQLANGTDFMASAGIDLKWHPTPDLTLDATFNPDFAQVEADQVVLNLSTFETYYPEKRPFFLEGIDALTTPFQLLYTRRIGRAAPYPSLRSDSVYNDQLVDVPSPATIYGATKLTGRLGEKWSIATVQAVTARNDVQVQLPDGTRQTRLVDPPSSFNVLRLKRDLGDNAHVAFMATATTHAEPTANYPLVGPDAAPYGSVLCPNPNELTPLQSVPVYVHKDGRCFNDAYVGGVDWRWRSTNGEFATGGQVIASILENGPVRQIADGTQIKPGDAGWGATAYVNKDGGDHWVGNLSGNIQSRKLEFNDLGYNQRANQIAGQASVEYRDLEHQGPFLEYHLSPSFGATSNMDGLLVGQGLYMGAWGRFKNFWGFYTDLHYRGTKFDDREVGDGTALEREGRYGHEIWLGTDPTKRFIANVDQITEVLFDGFNQQGNATFTARVLPQFDVDLMPNWQSTYGEPRFMLGAQRAGEYLFGKLDAKSIGVTLRSTYTFTPRLTLQAYAQLFLATAHYSHFTAFESNPSGPRPNVHVGDLTPAPSSELPVNPNPDFLQAALNVNVVLRWEYMLGSTLYVVYTRSQTPTTSSLDVGAPAPSLDLGAVGRAPASDAFLVKVSYWWGG